jgi:hypothetical protein
MRRKRRLRILLLVGLVIASGAHAGTGWRLEKDENGVRIESRTVPGWKIREMRGAARFDGRIASLLAVIDDPTVAQLNELVSGSKVVQRENARRYRVYTTTKMPWPLKDRDVLTQRVIDVDERSGAVTITDEAIDEGFPEEAAFVRVRRSYNRWTLTPESDGGVQIELRMLSDPAGPIPSSLINSMAVGTPLKMIERLIVLAQQLPYMDATEWSVDGRSEP